MYYYSGTIYFSNIFRLFNIIIINLSQYCYCQATTNGERIFTSCTYPVPTNPNFTIECTKSFHSLDILCDPQNAMTKTDTEQIRTVIGKNQCYSNSQIKVAVAALRTIYLPLSLPRRQSYSNLNSVTTETTISSSSSWSCMGDYSRELNVALRWRNGTSARRYLQRYVDTLARRWFRNECDTYLMILNVVDYVADWDKRKLLDFPVVQISIGRQLQNALGLQYSETLQRDMLTWHSEGLVSTNVVIKILDQIADRLGKLNRARLAVGATGHGQTIPFWAIYSFVGCFAALVLALLMDCLIVRKKALSLRGGGHSSGGAAGGGKPKSENVQVHLYF